MTRTKLASVGFVAAKTACDSKIDTTLSLYQLLLQYYSVLQSTTSVLRQYDNALLRTTLYYKVLLH